jgi:hypothetical protein
MTAALTGYGTCLPDGESLTEIPTNSDWFDVKTRLGRRGYRALPLPAQLTLAAVRELHGPGVEDGAHNARGLWLGSATAAAHCLDVLDTGILRDGTEMIPPTGAPYFSVNLVPARAVSEIGATGPCVTVTTAGTAGLDALLCAARAVRLGRVEEATVVVVEVPDPTRHEAPFVECGALALALRADTSTEPQINGTSRFRNHTPGQAADDVLNALDPEPGMRIVVLGDHVRHVLDRPVELAEGGGLAAAAILLEASTKGQDVAVVLVDSLGSASGVTLTQPRQETHS